jgi:hypothetical protein
VDQLEEKMEFPPGFSLGEIIDKLTDQKISQDRVITTVRVNGKELIEDENGLFPDLPGGEIESLELHTEQSLVMALRGIEDAKTYLDRLIEGVEKTVELFRIGEDTKSQDQYGLCLEGLNWFIQVLKGVGQVLELDYQSVLLNRVSIQSYIENLDHIIREMLTAQSDEDWVLLSDLLEYELLPAIQCWKDILPLIEETANDKVKGGKDQ